MQLVFVTLVKQIFSCKKENMKRNGKLKEEKSKQEPCFLPPPLLWFILSPLLFV